MKLLRHLLLMALSGGLLVGCVSPKFEKAWKNAANPPPAPAGAASPQRWIGRWESSRHGAGGRLRAVLTPPVLSRGESKGTMDAFFEARWHGFTTAYPVSLQSEAAEQKRGGAHPHKAAKLGAAPAVFKISGTHDLKSCLGGGTYIYTGSLSSSLFEARYESKYDTGVFRLAPQPAR